jgi:predicted ATP-dependent endonuclease of OLD family
MKVGRLLLKNVTSYRAETEFLLDPRLNILIGPNGGGKSNLQKVLAVVLTQFFVRQYQVRNIDSGSVLEPLELYNKRVLATTLSKFLGDESSQVIEIDLIPEASDVQNIRMIAEHLDAFNEHLSFYESKYASFPPATFADDIGKRSAFTYRIVDLSLEEDPNDLPKAAFREYLGKV